MRVVDLAGNVCRRIPAAICIGDEEQRNGEIATHDVLQHATARQHVQGVAGQRSEIQVTVEVEVGQDRGGGAVAREGV